MNRGDRIFATTTVTFRTLLGGPDDPNCFSLALRDGLSRHEVMDGDGQVRIVNMQLGPFRRVVAEYLADKRVEVELLSETVGLIVDPRVPEHELTPRWCTVCCPFRLIPEEQQRAFLRFWTPTIRDGKLVGWSNSMHDDNPPEVVDQWMVTLRESGAI